MEPDFLAEDRRRAVDVTGRGGLMTGIGTLVMILMVAACATLAAAAALGYKFAAVMPNYAASGHDFGALYVRYGMKPIPADDIDTDVAADLTKLEGEPCDWAVAHKLGRSLSKADDKRLAANFYIGFSDACAHNDMAVRQAAGLLYQLSDFKRSLQYSSDLTLRFPQNDVDWYNKGRAEAKLGMNDDALQSYATMLSLVSDKSRIGEWVFYEMAGIYAAKGDYCEAMTPIDTYVSIDPVHRDASRPREVLAAYSKRGHCMQYAKGEATFPVLDNNVVSVRATINGVTGTFMIDTGASFVTLTPAFAAKANVAMTFGTIQTATANGDAQVKLARAGTITLGGLKATDVPLVVVSKPIGQVDGLLGRSLLARYDMSFTRHHLKLTSKPVS